MTISTKFNVGDTAFFLNENKVVSHKVTEIKISMNVHHTTIEYRFVTKEANSMRDRDVSETREEFKVFRTLKELADSIASGK